MSVAYDEMPVDARSVASARAGRPGHPRSDRPLSGQVLVVILNFNGLDDTLACLDSLRDQSEDMAVLVVDNASSTGDLGRIAASHPWAELIALPENRGWAGGNNVGIRLAMQRGFGHVCLLNNDTVVDPGAIAALLDAARAIAAPCLLHPAIAYFDDPATWQLNPVNPGAAAEPAPGVVEMAHAYGACLLLPAGAVGRVGLLDERFFLQLEEADYFQRAKALGIRSYCAKRARVLHKECASFGGRVTETKTYYQVRNSLLLAEKHAGSVSAYMRSVRALLWMLHHQSGCHGWRDLAGWAVSSHPLARAARQGAGDYVARRFGPRPGRRPAGQARDAIA